MRADTSARSAKRSLSARTPPPGPRAHDLLLGQRHDVLRLCQLPEEQLQLGTIAYLKLLGCRLRQPAAQLLRAGIGDAESGAVLVGQHDEWAEGRRYLGLEVLKRSRIAVVNSNETEEADEPMTPAALTA